MAGVEVGIRCCRGGGVGVVGGVGGGVGGARRSAIGDTATERRLTGRRKPTAGY